MNRVFCNFSVINDDQMIGNRQDFFRSMGNKNDTYMFILKLMKLAVETDRFMQQLKTEGREQYSIGEYVEKVYNPVMNL